MKVRWDEFSWTEIEEMIKEDVPVILPVGAVEAHGSHLPLCTDTVQAVHVAESVARRIGALVLPPIHYGLTKGLSSFPGTISLGFDTVRGLVRDILMEITAHGVRKIMVLSGHAGSAHMAALRLACEEVIERHPDVRILLLSDYHIAYRYRGEIAPEDDGHAGFIETSRMLAIRPDLVGEVGEVHPGTLQPFRVMTDYREIYPEAVFSPPDGASAEAGEKLNHLIEDEIVDIAFSTFYGP